MRFYGTCRIEKGETRDDPWKWRLDVEPQVAIRAKRTFPKISASANVLSLDMTPENAFELDWFLIRYPLKMKAADHERMKHDAAEHTRRLSLIPDIVVGKKCKLKLKTALPLRDYQKTAASLAYHTCGLVLGDEVGLGKTASAIGVIAQADCRPAVVVTLTHLPVQWKKEIDRFLPGLNVHIAKKFKPPEFTSETIPDVVILNYSKLPGWGEFLSKYMRFIVFDEGHELRTGSGSNKYHAASVVAKACDRRMALTATPIFNNGLEMWNLLNVIKPDALGRKDEFMIEWCDTGGFVGNSKAFGSYLREIGVYLRRTKKDVGRELPPLTIVPCEIEANEYAFERSVGSIADLARTVLSQNGTGLQKMRAAEELSWKLRQATGVAKAPFLAAFIRMLVESSGKVLCGLWHHAVYDILEDALRDLNPVRFSGRESEPQKRAAIKRFCEGDSQVCLMSDRAGQGLDGLQRVCSTVVIGELDWSPAVHEQFIGRVDRDGQLSPVMAYFPLANIGSDPVIADVVGVKAQQLEGIRDPGNTDAIKQIDPDRIKKLALDYLQRNKLPLDGPTIAPEALEEEFVLEPVKEERNPF